MSKRRPSERRDRRVVLRRARTRSSRSPTGRGPWRRARRRSAESTRGLIARPLPTLRRPAGRAGAGARTARSPGARDPAPCRSRTAASRSLARLRRRSCAPASATAARSWIDGRSGRRRVRARTSNQRSIVACAVRIRPAASAPQVVVLEVLERRLDARIHDPRPRRRRADRVAAEVRLACRAASASPRSARRGSARGGSPTPASPSPRYHVRSTSTSSSRSTSTSVPSRDHERLRSSPPAPEQNTFVPWSCVVVDVAPAHPRPAPGPRPTRRASDPRGRSRRAPGAPPRSDGPRRCRPTEPSALATCAHQRPLLPRVRRRQRGSFAAPRTPRAGSAARRPAPPRSPRSPRSRPDGERSRRCTTPGGTQDSRPGSAPANPRQRPGLEPFGARLRDQRPDQLRRRAPPSPAARRSPTPSCASTIPPRAARSCSSIASALSPRQSCVSAVHPTIVRPRSSRELGVNVARCPHGIRHHPGRTPCSSSTLQRPIEVLLHVLARRERVPQVLVPMHLHVMPGRDHPLAAAPVRLHPLPEHEERRPSPRPLRAPPAPPASPAGPAHHRTSAQADATARAATPTAARLRVRLVGVAQLVELRVVVPAAAGSSPVAHPS